MLIAGADHAAQRSSLSDEATQMRGMPYGSAGATQFNDIQRSQDTATIRGFRYRDASRGMNLGEDMDGVVPRRGDRQRPERRLLDGVPGQHGARRRLRHGPRVRGRRGDRRRDARRREDDAARAGASTCSATRSGAAHRRPTARTRSSSAAWPRR